MNEEKNVISLLDEDDNEMNFEILDFVEYEEREYIVLTPEEDDELAGEAGSVVILEVAEGEDGSEEYFGVEDEDLLETVYEIFKQNNADVFDFVD